MPTEAIELVHVGVSDKVQRAKETDRDTGNQLAIVVRLRGVADMYSYLISVEGCGAALLASRALYLDQQKKGGSLHYHVLPESSKASLSLYRRYRNKAKKAQQHSDDSGGGEGEDAEVEEVEVAVAVGSGLQPTANGV